MDSVASLRSPWLNAVEEDDLFAHLLHRYVEIDDRGDLIGKAREFLVVCGKKRLCFDPCGKFLGHGPRDGDPIEGARATPHLIEDDQTMCGRTVENRRRLKHLHHKRAHAFNEHVAGSHTGEDAIDDGQDGLACWDERADLGQKTNQRCLAQVDRLPRHVRPGEDHEVLSLLQHQVVWHELFHLFDDRMPTGADYDRVLCSESRPHISISFRRDGQG